MSDLSTKSFLRTIIKKNLKDQESERYAKSALIWDRLNDLDEFKRARDDNNIMVYMDFDLEVLTRPFLPRFLDIPSVPYRSASKTYRDTMSRIFGSDVPSSDIFMPIRSVIVPYCEEGEIVPFRMRSLDELEPGSYGIMEPSESLRNLAERHVDPEEIRLVLVPGIAFDSRGNRLGRGKGFYDRFLARLSGATRTVALAFECQVVENVPARPYDRPVEIVVTEERTINVRE